ncbi:MAG: triose-phosphate isomerase [Actinobacteria bacterium]|nr:triose-phosphate isomerase [Actinomycetota bacterium]
MRYVLANWKMYPTVDEALTLLRAIQEGLRRRQQSDRHLPLVIVCSPFVSLVPLRAEADERLVRLGAQNCHWEAEGPHTGEISPPMLRGLVDYVMVGHSERRAAGETDDQVADKVAAVAGAGLVPILFVGEDEQGDHALAQTERRLRHGVRGVDLARRPVLVVYEPTWAIGAERPADAAYVGGMVEHLKAELRRLGSSRPEVLYGGTVADENVGQFARLDVLDGVGATRGSLDAERFLAMIDRVTDPLPPGPR